MLESMSRLTCTHFRKGKGKGKLGGSIAQMLVPFLLLLKTGLKQAKTSGLVPSPSSKKKSRKTSRTTPCEANMTPTVSTDYTPYVLIPVLSVFSVYVFIGVTWFWLRRDFQPIRARKVSLAIGTVLGFWTAGMTININRGFPTAVSGINCLVSVSVPVCSTAAALTLLVMRALLLNVQIAHAETGIQIVNNRSGVLDEEKESPRGKYASQSVMGKIGSSGQFKFKFLSSKSFCKNLFLVDSKYWIKWIVPLILVQWILLVLVYFKELGGTSYLRSDMECQRFINPNFSRASFFIINGMHMSVLLFLVIRLWTFHDRRGIRTELIQITFVYAFVCAVQVANSVSGDVLENDFFTVLGFRGWMIIQLILPYSVVALVSMYIPTKATYRLSNDSLGDLTGGSLAQELQIVVDTPELLAAFEEFLKSELSVENILFIKDLRNFKKGLISALDVYNMYLKPGSFLCVNVSSKTRNKLVARFELKPGAEVTTRNSLIEPSALSSDLIFEAAEEEVMALMKNDSFVRFRMTEEYRKLKLDGGITLFLKGEIMRGASFTITQAMNSIVRGASSSKTSSHPGGHDHNSSRRDSMTLTGSIQFGSQVKSSPPIPIPGSESKHGSDTNAHHSPNSSIPSSTKTEELPRTASSDVVEMSESRQTPLIGPRPETVPLITGQLQ
jgi:hypothetical protein